MLTFQKLFAGRWISGPYASDAINVAKILQKAKISSIFNFLGEEIHKDYEVDKTVSEYMHLLNSIKKQKLNCSISIKPTQIGLLLGKKELEKNYIQITEMAKKFHIFVWLDMESSEHVSETISLYLNNINNNYSGICLQSYLKRTMADVEKLSKMNGIIRLVKGAYSIDRSLSYNKKNSTLNYLKIMKYFFENNDRFMLATHDLNLLNTSFSLCKRYKKEPQYAMLYGIRNKLAIKFALTHDMNLYVPFGKSWLSYSYRRLRESSNLALVIRSLFEKQTIS